MPLRGKEITPQMRSRICELRSYGIGPTKIREKYPYLSINTIKYTLRMEQKRRECVSLPRSGAPRKLSEEQRDRIYDIVTHENPHITIPDLLAEVDHAVKERSIRILLREMGKRKWLQLKRPQLTNDHAARRLAWARQYETVDWRRVKWSDECMVKRGHGAQPIYTFTRPCEQLAAHDIAEYRPRPVKQMFWAAFGWNSRTGLVALDGHVDGQGIYDLYSSFLPDFLEPDDIFMQDNAPVHTARIVRQLLEEMGIAVMLWPPYSPDLNPIENLWGLMKVEIYKIYPELKLAADTEATRQQLLEAAKEAWHAIDESIHNHLIETMPHRIAAVIAADGWYTKY